MAYREYFETDEYYLLRFEPALSEEELSLLPNPYIGRHRNRKIEDCSDIADSGWPYSAQLGTEYAVEPLLALNKHSLVLAALSNLGNSERRNRLDTIPHIEHLALLDYLSKIAKLHTESKAVAAV